MSTGNCARARSREQWRLAHCASCAKGQDGGGVYTSSDPPPPPPQVFLNFLIGIVSGADVETAAPPSAGRRSAARAPPFRGLSQDGHSCACFWVAVGVACASFCRCRAHSFCSGFVSCKLRRMRPFNLVRADGHGPVCVRCVCAPVAGRTCRGVRLGSRIVSGRRFSVAMHAFRIEYHEYTSVRLYRALGGR